MALTTLDPAARHRAIGGRFTELVEGTTDWNAPAPVAGWTARDVVGHVIEWLPPLLAGGAGVALPSNPGVDDDPVLAWRVHVEGVQALLDDPTTPGLMLINPHIGKVPLDRAVDQFYTADVFQHTWDLARATGQNDRLDPDFCAALLAGMEPMDELLRSSGQYGPPVPTSRDADAQTRLIGFIGRDPFWTAP
jgi:uncharacterized protein (TIGR03086 family)